MACYRCGGQVEERSTLVDFTEALIAGDLVLARILMDRVYSGEDRVVIGEVLARAMTRRAA